MSAGTKSIGQATGRPITLAADGNTIFRPIGAAPDWESLNGAASATVLPDDTQIAAGQKYFRYGTVFVRHAGTATVQTVTLSDTPDAGGISFRAIIRGKVKTTDILPAADITDATKVTALFVDGFGADFVSTAVYAAKVFTITFKTEARKVEAITTTTDFEESSTPVTAITAITTAGDDSTGFWRPWKQASGITNIDSTGGLVRGEVGILNQTVVLTEPGFHTGYLDEDLQGLIEGGLIFSERLNIASGDVAALLAAMPLLRFAPKQF